MSPLRLLSAICHLSNILFTLLVIPLVNLIWEFGVGLAANPVENDHTESREIQDLVPFSEQYNGESTLSITVVGASGDLAKKKIFPALFALYYDDFLPKVLGFVSSLCSHFNDTCIPKSRDAFVVGKWLTIFGFCDIFAGLLAELYSVWLCSDENER